MLIKRSELYQALDIIKTISDSLKVSNLTSIYTDNPGKDLEFALKVIIKHLKFYDKVKGLK